MAFELLRNFQKQTGKAPERVIFYRDGVSEGQFDQVARHEIAALKSERRTAPGHMGMHGLNGCCANCQRRMLECPTTALKRSSLSAVRASLALRYFFQLTFTALVLRDVRQEAPLQVSHFAYSS